MQKRLGAEEGPGSELSNSNLFWLCDPTELIDGRQVSTGVTNKKKD